MLENSELWSHSERLGVTHPIAQNIDELKELLKSAPDIHIYSHHKTLLRDFLSQNTLPDFPITPLKNPLARSFRYGESIHICDDIIAHIFVTRRVKRKLSDDVDLLLKIQQGDYIVHMDHGIGIFQ